MFKTVFATLMIFSVFAQANTVELNCRATALTKYRKRITVLKMHSSEVREANGEMTEITEKALTIDGRHFSVNFTNDQIDETFLRTGHRVLIARNGVHEARIVINDQNLADITLQEMQDGVYGKYLILRKVLNCAKR